MPIAKQHGQIAAWFTLGLASLVSAAGLGVWSVTPSEFRGTASADHIVHLDVPYDEFRTAMVRNNATKSIVEQGGMRVLNEETVSVDVDLTNDDRPLLNAILRRSKACLSANKRLTVSLKNESISADQLVLSQHAKITPECIDVDTTSDTEAGDLKSYRACLHAEPDADGTLIRVAVQIDLAKQLCKLFHGEAQQQLEKAAEQSAVDQCEALAHFAEQNCRY